MPSVSAMSAIRAADTVASRASERAAVSAYTTSIADGEDRDHERVGGDAEPEPEASQERAGQHEQEGDGQRRS